ncbi:MAG: hypothetical protein K2K31_01260 [Clostridia bacterium]|nr:hypothetical protein [Clostridia bacterium]
MGWFNYYGLIAVCVVMLPNIFCAIFDKTAFENKIENKFLLVFEQIGRIGCVVFMTCNIPYTYLGFWFESALLVYLIVGGVLLLAYCLGWVVFGKSKSLVKTLWLSITPTILFLFCGIMIVSAPLILCSILFGVGHIGVNYKNYQISKNI